jgi:hypothetical protein
MELHVLFSGYAKPPTGTCLNDKPIGVIVTVNVTNELIMAADCTLFPEVSRKFISRLLVGQSLANGSADIVQEITNCYLDPHCRAIVAAIRIINEKYAYYKKQNISGQGVASQEGPVSLVL